MSFLGNSDYQHHSQEKIGILLVNLGTPDAPTPKAVRRYLKQFLSDPRVIETPKWLWWFILRLLILPTRPKRSAKAYQEVWTEEGSPLLSYSRAQQSALQACFVDCPVEVELGMVYGEPSIPQALERLRKKDIRRLLVLPLYPQYAASTIGSVFDVVTRELSRWRWIPDFRFINGYCDDSRYIDVLGQSITQFRNQYGSSQLLIFSYHGMPLDMLLKGDPYHCWCHKTSRLVAQKLGLADSAWQLTFQSRFGNQPWLQPYTDQTLAALPKQGITDVQIICPAFASDCLETLEEIEGENKDIFINAGGKQYCYIPALNAHPSHIQFLYQLTLDTLSPWLSQVNANNEGRALQEMNFKKLQQNKFYCLK